VHLWSTGTGALSWSSSFTETHEGEIYASCRLSKFSFIVHKCWSVLMCGNLQYIILSVCRYWKCPVFFHLETYVVQRDTGQIYFCVQTKNSVPLAQIMNFHFFSMYRCSPIYNTITLGPPILMTVIQWWALQLVDVVCTRVDVVSNVVLLQCALYSTSFGYLVHVYILFLLPSTLDLCV